MHRKLRKGRTQTTGSDPSRTPVAKQGSREVRIHVRIQLIAHFVLLGLSLLGQDIGDASKHDCNTRIEDGGIVLSTQEHHAPKVHQDHADRLADVLPDGIQHLQQVLVEKGLQDKSTEDQDHGAVGPFPKHAITQNAVLHHHVHQTGKGPRDLQARKLHRERVAIPLERFGVQHRHVAADADLDDGKANAEGAEGHGPSLGLADEDVLEHTGGGREENEPLHHALGGAIEKPHQARRDDQL
mmetsp:Transcript_41130/g.85855  ORF Transcript_41130/g.85855 Transcript_41130/m.85855 type:complete len:241 (+) Transcript_41130:205-927(+)